MKKKSKSTDSKMLKRIYGHGRGWVFTPTHFKDLGSRNAIASALKRYKQTGLIRQLGRGLYDYPQSDPELGILQPSASELARAIAGREAARLQPTGAYAANLLGLSTQVPVKITWLTDAPSRTVRVGKRQIILRHTTPRNLACAGKVSGLIIQALRYLGQKNVDQQVVAQLDKILDEQGRKQLAKSVQYAPAWIADIIHDLVNMGEVE